MANIGKNWNFEEAAVDSLKVRIPLHKVNVLNKSLESNWLLVNEGTGEIDAYHFKKNAYKHSENGISTRFAIESQVTENQVVEQFITILLPSKVLKEKYFEGLTLENIHLAHSYLISLQVVDFSLETFLEGQCTDVDFKKDRVTKDLPSIIKECEARTKESAKKREGHQSFTDTENMGIEWSDRRTTKFKTHPYLKIYHKEKELKYNSKEFSDCFLTSIDFRDVVRVETTIKNRKHFKQYQVEDTTLRSILSITSEIKDAFISKAVNIHIGENARSKAPKEGLSPRDAIFVNMFQQCMERGMSWRVIRESNLDAIDRQTNFEDEKSVAKNRVAKWREEKHLDELYRMYILDTPYDKFTKKLDETFGGFFKWLGYDSLKT